jgi:hypothetical protein
MDGKRFHRLEVSRPWVTTDSRKLFVIFRHAPAARFRQEFLSQNTTDVLLFSA